MDVSPLALVMILGYGLLLAFCLTALSFLSPLRERERTRTQAGESEVEREDAGSRRKPSNDDVRGARLPRDVTVTRPGESPPGESRPPARARERSEGEDAFERFIRAGRDDDFR